MRLLQLNGEIADIDDSTAIGIDLQGYDVTEPGSRKVAASNNFTIPKTAKNMRLIGFAGNPQSISTIPYSPITCRYWNQNKCLIHNGTARIVEVSDRISVFAFEKSTCWTDMQDLKWPEFQSELIVWLQTNGLPSAANPFVGSFADFIAPYITATTGVVLPFFISNLALYDPADGTAYIENTGSLYLKYNATVEGVAVNGLGGHFSVYCKTIFEFIEYKYGVDFSVTDVTSYNIFQDAIASLMYTPLRNLSIQHTASGFYFRYDDEAKFLPEDTNVDKEGKTLYDFTKAFFQHFNCLIDRIPKLDNSEKYIIRRFDDIINAPVVNLDIDEVSSFAPMLDGYNQNNWIKFSGIYEDGDALTNSKKIVCNNKNLDVGSSDDSLFDIDAYIPSGYKAGGNVVLDLSPSDSFSQFSFFISSGNASTTVKSIQEGAEVSASVILPIAQLYSLDGEYNILASMVAYPSFYTAKKWLSLSEVEAMVYFTRYYVKKLNGYFFLNKIESYNPEKSTEPTKVELIKIPT